MLILGKCSESTCSSLSSCMTDPTSAACTAVYGGSTALPAVLAGNKCISEACSWIKHCILMKFVRASQVIHKCPIIASLHWMILKSICISGKCSEATCSSLSSCMTDPTSTACTAVYGASAALPAVLAGNKCIYDSIKLGHGSNIKS